MIFFRDEYFTFDDVLLQPMYTEIQSRQDVSLKTRLTKNITMDIPIISANMDTITESEMMMKMVTLGGIGILHRFMTIEKMIDNAKKFSEWADTPFAFSIGVGDDAIERIYTINSLGLSNRIVVCIDIAHGHCLRVIDLIKKIKNDYFGKIDVIAGNVSTYDGVRHLCLAGADAVKVGIGPGSMCSTRLVTGCGTPQLTAIMQCSVAAKEFNIPIIADGGITKSGDIVKALAAGAESVMIGGLFAGTDETPGEVNISGSFQDRACTIPIRKPYKKYRGMASQDAMIGWKGEGYHATPEGESKTVECKGPVANVVNDLLGGIRSGMTYCNARDLKQLEKNAIFCKVSSNTLIENKPHGK